MLSLVGLYFGAVLAASLVPFSSEIMLIAVLRTETYDWWIPVAVATAGNVTGALINWTLGRFLLHWSDRKWFPFSAEQLARASDRFNRFGAWSLLFSWLPIIGDPLTFAAGVLRMPLPLFLILVTIGKASRYFPIVWAF